MRYLSVLLLFVLTVSCQKSSDQLSLSGSVKGLKRGTIILQQWNDSVMTTIDSVYLDGTSNFKIKTLLTEPEVYYLTIRLKDGVFMDDEIAFFAEPGKMNIQTKLEQFGSAAQVSGSVNDSLWRAYNKLKQRYVDKNLELIQKKLTLKSNTRDSVIQIINRKEEALKNSKYMTTVNFALSHKDKEIAPYLILNEAYPLRAKYLDTVYQSLTPEIKTSKYGKALEQLLNERLEQEK